jgi:cytochrome P450/ferredoxin-NADP reductase
MAIAPESTAASAAPSNGPTDLSVFYDPLSYTVYDHPYETYRQLRDHAPVFYNAERDLYVVSRYADVKACLRNHGQLVNALGNDIDGTHDSYGVGMLVCQDPPRHTALRDAIRHSFGAHQILSMEDGLRIRARQLIAPMREAGGGEFTSDVALPLAFDAALKLVGAPATDAPFFIDHLWRAMVRTVGRFGVPDDAAEANRESEEHLADIVERRRRALEAGGDRSAGDAITQILLSVERGTVDRAEVVGLAHLVLSAATDAPAALLSNCVAVLDRFPALQAHLAERPHKIANFVEEVLRFESPAQNLCRQTTDEVTIGEVTIPANSRVMVLLASANRDERVFGDPDTFNVDRVFTPASKVLAFGEGIHSCMGAPLARLAARVMVAELVDGSEVRIVGMPKRWVKQMVRGYSELPVTLTRPSERSERPIEAAHHRSTRLTLAGGWSVASDEIARPREFEAAVRVEAKEVVAEGIVTLALREVDGQPLPRWDPGAHVDLILDEAATRQYSLCGDPDTPHAWRLGILRDPAGSGGSLYVHDQLEIGDVVRVRGPRNNFPLVDSPRYLFIAGGIGITPILPMIRAAEAGGAEWQLVYGGRRRASMAFLDELGAYGDRVVVRPQDHFGLLDLDSLLGEPQPDTKVYCCGPEPLLAAVEERCTRWPKRSLHVERFVAKPLAAPIRQEAFEVYLARSEVTVTVSPDTSILRAIEDAGVPVLSSCSEGTCGTCETAVLDGLPDHRDSVLDEEARDAGDCMMICVSRSCTARLVLDL